MTPQSDDIELLTTFCKSAQYLVGLPAGQDLWEHLARLIVTHFKADWTAVVQQDSAGELSIDHCLLSSTVVRDQLLSDDVRAMVEDVLGSGFLASKVIATPAASLTVVLPIAGEHQANKALLIGHASQTALPQRLLNIYLALAGLAGTMLDRLHAEGELQVHRAHLEELVKARTAELAMAKRQNELILNAIAEGILGVDVGGKITFVNPAAASLTGWTADELVGRAAHDTLHHSRADGSEFPIGACPIHASLTHGQTILTDGIFFRKDGSRFPVEFKTSPIVEEGNIVGAVLVFRDTTQQQAIQAEREQAQQKLRRTAEDLARSNKDLEQFAYVSSHDLQEPLRMVRGFMQLLDKKYHDKLDAVGSQYIHYAVDGATRMQQLIDDLLAYSRVESKGKEPQLINSQAALDSALANLQSSIEHTAAEVAHGPLPTVRADPTQLAQLFQNLIGNALKFRGDRRPKIRVEACPDGERWLFSVSDNGIGIEPEFHDRIFVIFQRLHTKDKYPGTGIGLAICKKIVERHGGTIWLQSKPDAGTTFYFTLPA